MVIPSEEILEECYTIRGNGGFSACVAVQERLQNHGLCSYTRWDPEPPHWRFFFETYLSSEELGELLGDLKKRFNIRYK